MKNHFSNMVNIVGIEMQEVYCNFCKIVALMMVNSSKITMPESRPPAKIN